MSSSQGDIARRLGSAIRYGFITEDADKKLVVTERGIRFLSDDAQVAKEAERQALMSTPFGVVVKSLSTRKADPAVVAFRLQEDQGSP